MQIKSNKRGYTLVEAIIYVSVLAVFFIIIVNSLVSFTKPYRNILVLRTIDRSGLEAMEKLSREIKKSTAVDLIASTFGTNPGVLSLVATSNGFSTTTRLYLDNGILKVDVNGVYYGPLTNSTTTVTNLVFNRMTSGVSSAIKIDMTIQMTNGSIIKNKSYHSTVIIKGV